MTAKVICINDYEPQSPSRPREPNAEDSVIILPVIRVERHVEPRKRTKRKSR